MVTSALIVGGATISILYNASFEETRQRLTETAKIQSALIQHALQIPQGETQDTDINAILETAHSKYENAATKVEIVFAKRVGETIQFLFKHRHQQLKLPAPVPFTSDTAEPMRHALLGKSGSIEALDYRNEDVLAAYEPINGGEIGIVAKMDINEIRAPFLAASLISLILWIAVITVASFFTRKLIIPLIQHSNNQTKHLRAIIENANSAIVVTDATGIVEEFNPCAVKIFGYTTDEVIGCNVSMLTPQPIRQEHDSYMERYMTTREPHVVGSSREVQGLRKDGTLVYLDFALGFIDTADDKKFVGLLHDITVIKEKEKQLYQAVKVAQEANAAKSSFLANMSHEIRTPLNAINGYAELVSMELMGPIGNKKYIEYINDIHLSGRHLQSLMEDLLDMAKIEAGELKIDEAIIDLNELIDEILKFLNPLLNEKEIGMEISINEPIKIRGDKRAFKQILINLVSNAVKFSHPTGKIKISATMKDDIEISISDGGIGIPETFHDKIFDPFFHIASPGTTKETGTGLGLSIVRELIQIHDGKISVESSQGVGTCFTITLPKERNIKDCFNP